MRGKKIQKFNITSKKKVLVLFFFVLAAFLFLFIRLNWLIQNNESRQACLIKARNLMVWDFEL